MATTKRTEETKPTTYEPAVPRAERLLAAATERRELLEAQMQAVGQKVEAAQTRYVETEDPADWAQVGELERELNRLRLLHGARVRTEAEATATLRAAKRERASACLGILTDKLTMAAYEEAVGPLYAEFREAFGRMVSLRETILKKSHELDATAAAAAGYAAECGEGAPRNERDEAFAVARLAYELHKAATAAGLNVIAARQLSPMFVLDALQVRNMLAQAMNEGVYESPVMPPLNEQMLLLAAGPGHLTADVLPKFKAAEAELEQRQREFDQRRAERERSMQEEWKRTGSDVSAERGRGYP